MVPAAIPPLCWCCLWALPAALLTPACLPAGALCAMAGVLFALWSARPWRWAGLAALPVCVAAVPLPPPPLPPLPIGPVAITGIVAGTSRVPATGTVHVLLGSAGTSLRVTLDGELELLPGDRLHVIGNASAPTAPGLPAGVHGIAATARVTAGTWSLRRAAAAARRALERQLTAHVPGEPGAMLAALVLGRDTRPDRGLMEAHRATGLSHLLAVSGAHAAMLALLLGLSGRRRGRRLAGGARRTIAVLALLFAYAAITGNEPPVLRAVVAFSIAALAVHTGRPSGIATGLLAPAVLTCVLQPDALRGPSFLLSYAAVAGLALAGPERGSNVPASFVGRWLLAPLRASAWATLLTTPLTLWFFGQLAPWTVLLTPLLAPVVGALLLGGLLLALLGCVLPGLATLLAWPVGGLARCYADAVRLADHLPLTPVHAWCAVAPWVIALAALAAVVVLVRRPTRGGCAVAALALSLPHFLPFAARAPDRFVLFAVGHGQAALVAAGGHHTALDCGSVQHPLLAAERLVAALPVRRLDLLVVTHDDHDHHNGVPTLLGRLGVAHAVLPASLGGSPLAALLEAHGTAVQLLAPGERTRPAPHLDVFAPDLPVAAGDNDQSLWVRFRIGTARVLATGDAQELGVAAAIAAGIATPHDVLLLPHHGRPNAAAPALLLRVQPRACLASAAAADGETALGGVSRRLGADLWVTGQHGTLTVGGEPLQIAGGTGGRAIPPRPQ